MSFYSQRRWFSILYLDFAQIFVKLWSIASKIFKGNPGAIMSRMQSSTDLKWLLLESGGICAFLGYGRAP